MHGSLAAVGTSTQLKQVCYICVIVIISLLLHWYIIIIIILFVLYL
jgi:hypothetical protein